MYGWCSISGGQEDETGDDPDGKCRQLTELFPQYRGQNVNAYKVSKDSDIATGFAVAYCLIGCILVYKIAPRTFKIRP